MGNQIMRYVHEQKLSSLRPSKKLTSLKAKSSSQFYISVNSDAAYNLRVAFQV